VFKNITINLERPICNCKNGNLDWGIHIDDNKAGLSIRCVSCNMLVKVPNNLFRANFAVGNAPSNYFDERPLPNNVIKLRR
jgi:hypothetical protein